ncbi:MAG TPA: hypothetical protein VE010_16140 [Thermoanaerobaculia bacterium]|nr:hypothetical protein [Thermoanaerobaculia bacterium]
MGRHSEDAVTGRAARLASGGVLAAAIAIAAFLRLDALGDASYWLDEILHQQLMMQFAALPWWRWLGCLHEEHAGLYYATQLATRLVGTDEGAGRLAAALFGIATVPVTWMLVRFLGVHRVGGALAAGVAAILLAVSPLHVYYSREARSYGLLTLLAASLALVLLRGRSLAAVCALLAAMLYTSAVSATIVIAAMVVAALCAIASTERRRFDALAAGCCALTLPLFRVVYASRPVEETSWPGFPPFDTELALSMVRAFSASAFSEDVAGRAVIAMLLFAVAGALALARTARRDAIVLIGMTLMPVAVSIAALKVLDHFFTIRYVMPAVFGYVALVAIGIVAVAQLVAFPLRRWRAPAAAAIAAVITIVTAAQLWRPARTEPVRKLDWRAIAAVLAQHGRPEDIVLTAEPWSDVSLRYYLEQHARRPRIGSVQDVVMASLIRDSQPATFLVTAGYEESAMRRWMCGYPLIAASPLESFRLHYASRSSDFVRERGGAPQARALAAALGTRGFTLRMDEPQFFGEGWALHEHSRQASFRWAVGTRATLNFPRSGARDRVVRISVMPFNDPSLPPQTLRVIVNDAVIAETTLAPQWAELSFAVPAARWQDGWNTLAFEFGRAHAPASLDPSAHDARPLAANFEWIAIDDAGAPRSRERDRHLALLPRSSAGSLINAKTIWRDTEKLIDASLRREEVIPLLGRLGLDPDAVWPRVERGELRVEELVESIGHGQDCVDDATFIDQAFAIVIERDPSEAERADLMRRIREGSPRSEIVRRLIRSSDFHRRYLVD